MFVDANFYLIAYLLMVVLLIFLSLPSPPSLL